MPPIPPHHVIHEFEKFAAPQPTLLTVYLDYVTAYYQDSLTLLATKPIASIDPALGNNFFPLEVVGDIVGINGDATVKGLYLSKNLVTSSSPTPHPGTNISDTTIVGFRHDIFKILYPDPMAATPATMEIGSITASGASGKPIPPGEPPKIVGGDWAITGGTGAFLGVTGQIGGEGGGNIRATSVTEDPSKRRVNASPSGTYTQTIGLYVIPMMPPQIIEVCHAASGMPVKQGDPAIGGETLIIYATGLGPVRYQSGLAWVDVPIGQLFPANTTVISPVTVTIGNTPVLPDPIAAQNTQGVPGFSNGYSVEFKMPPVPSPGTTSIQISSAWIQSAEHKLHVA